MRGRNEKDKAKLDNRKEGHKCVHFHILEVLRIRTDFRNDRFLQRQASFFFLLRIWNNNCSVLLPARGGLTLLCREPWSPAGLWSPEARTVPTWSWSYRSWFWPGWTSASGSHLENKVKQQLIRKWQQSHDLENIWRKIFVFVDLFDNCHLQIFNHFFSSTQIIRMQIFSYTPTL